MSVNKVILVGRLGKDPEVRHTGGGQAVANFTLATDETWKDRNGERQKRTEWHKVVAWGKLADEVIGKYCTKGMLVYVEGKLQTRDWTDKENVKRYTTEIVINNLRMLSGGNGRNDDRNEEPSGEYADNDSGRQPRSSAANTPEISDEDIPF